MVFQIVCTVLNRKPIQIYSSLLKSVDLWMLNVRKLELQKKRGE